MTEITPDPRAADLDPAGQVALLEMSLGRAQVKVRVRVTPTGLLAIGGLVSGILLSTAARVWSLPPGFAVTRSRPGCRCAEA